MRIFSSVSSEHSKDEIAITQAATKEFLGGNQEVTCQGEQQGEADFELVAIPTS
ncbi:MAG: hypothetical protein M2R45_04880 [Verrucomicrobia subdivision 3 bacterium]|nr:hypothetical protein [Limisphaerales bacterium]MCS1414374.1 hypothetical protein [Limisphaerales bacterium]